MLAVVSLSEPFSFERKKTSSSRAVFASEAVDGSFFCFFTPFLDSSLARMEVFFVTYSALFFFF